VCVYTVQVLLHPAMVFTNSQNDGESRFAHFMQPIRDLSTNWDIDLASELEDYLSEVKWQWHSFIHMCTFHFQYFVNTSNITKQCIVDSVIFLPSFSRQSKL